MNDSFSNFKLIASEDVRKLQLEWEIFRIGSHVDVTEFTIGNVSVNGLGECTKKMDFGKRFSCLYGRIELQRNLGNYFVKRFIPSAIIVMTSFIGFWIPVNTSPARTLLPIASLLALITQQVQAGLNVSYVYSLQIWNMFCIIFVFAAVFEYAYSLHVMHIDTKQMKKQQEEKKSFVEKSKDQTFNDRLREYFKTTSMNSSIDRISRVLFPGAFITFIIVFYLFFV